MCFIFAVVDPPGPVVAVLVLVIALLLDIVYLQVV